MKNLFVTFNAKTKKKERHDIFRCCERKEEKIDNNENLNLTSPPPPENSLNNILNTSASSTINSSIDSGKMTYNFFIPEQPFSVNPNFSVNSNINTNNSNNSDSNKFLGKKTKIRFDIIKNEETKGINSNNCNIFNISNSQSTDGSIINKDTDKNESFELNQEKIEKTDNNDFYDNTYISIKKLKIRQNNGYLNEGRWSFKEHIKFIEAIAEYGKNWKDGQKYVGSRTSAQARSHAQKFFLKLKTIKNTNYDFDFSSKNIKNLSDIIEIIKKKEEYRINGKDYIINTLINLSKTISCENIDLYKKNTKNDLYKEKDNGNENEKDYDYTFSSNKDIKFDIYNDNDNDINNTSPLKTEKRNKSKTHFYIKNNVNENNIDNIDNIQNKDNKNNITNEENKNITDNKITNENGDDIINDNKTNKDDLNKEASILLNNNIKNINNNKVEEKTKYIQKEDNYLMLEEKNNRFIIDDGIIYLTDNIDILDINNISFTIKEYYYLKSYELPYLFYNKYFYS
jgi:SHAQKYF class myb-like DNA-binding protein